MRSITVKLNGTDVTQYMNSMTWSGSANQCSRSFTFTVPNSPYDSEFNPLSVAIGNVIKAYCDKALFFVGTVTSCERNGSIGTVSYTATDFMVHLLKSTGSYKFKKKTAEAITKKICADLNITTGHLASTNVKIDKLICEDTAFYNIMLKAYRKAAKHTGKKYMPCMDGKKVSVIEKGKNSGVELKQNTNITASSYSENIDSMVNKVVIYNEKGKRLGVVSNANWTKKYGIYQSTYTKEDGKNAKTAAKNMLTGKEKTASVEGIGDMAAISGYSLNITDEATKLKGKFWIESDTHTFENGTHTMSLELAFKNTMETVS